jgi:hypothetical protein
MPVTEAWPGVLPLPTFEGYGLEPKDGILRTEMEAGEARQREQFTSTPTAIPARFRFTQFQFGIFESWYQHNAKNGAAYFNMELLGGLGMVTHEARFLGAGKKKYSAVPFRGDKSGAKWIVTTTLEIRKRPVLTKEALDLCLSEDIEALLSEVVTFETLIETTLAGPSGWS